MIDPKFMRLFRLTLLTAGLGLTTGAFGANDGSADTAVSAGQIHGVQAADATAQTASLEIYKSPTCGCCRGWVAHMREAGFTPQVKNTGDLSAVKRKLGIAPRYQSCHTAISGQGNYFFEGHVPARIIQRFLLERPANAAGLAVPGMPPGSPGMEMGGRFNAYQVLQINKDGSAQVYAEITSPEQQY